MKYSIRKKTEFILIIHLIWYIYNLIIFKENTLFYPLWFSSGHENVILFINIIA